MGAHKAMLHSTWARTEHKTHIYTPYMYSAQCVCMCVYTTQAKTSSQHTLHDNTQQPTRYIALICWFRRGSRLTWLHGTPTVACTPTVGGYNNVCCMPSPMLGRAYLAAQWNTTSGLGAASCCLRSSSAFTTRPRPPSASQYGLFGATCSGPQSVSDLSVVSAVLGGCSVWMKPAPVKSAGSLPCLAFNDVAFCSVLLAACTHSDARCRSARSPGTRQTFASSSGLSLIWWNRPLCRVLRAQHWQERAPVCPRCQSFVPADSSALCLLMRCNTEAIMREHLVCRSLVLACSTCCTSCTSVRYAFHQSTYLARRVAAEALALSRTSTYTCSTGIHSECGCVLDGSAFNARRASGISQTHRAYIWDAAEQLLKNQAAQVASCPGEEDIMTLER